MRTPGWAARRLQVLRRDPFCVICRAHGVTRAATDVDHIKALEFGGTDAMDNLQGLCRECHKAKTAKERGHDMKTPVGVDGWPLSSDHHWNKER